MNLRNKFLLFLLMAWAPVLAQDNIVKKSTVTVKGTSTLHDWHMETDAARGQASFALGNEGQLSEIRNLRFTLQAEDLKSDKEALDKNAYKALNTSKHKSITFQYTRTLGIEQSGNASIVNLEGKLTIAGTTKTVPLKATCTIGSNKEIRCKGEKAFKMTDFNVEPPSLMFGSIKTGDDITIVFDVAFSPDAIVSTN